MLTPEAMREADRITIEDRKTASIDLMESAANAICKSLISSYGKQDFFVLCGRGNNGGDGLAVARLLIDQGEHVTVLYPGGVELSIDAQENLARLKRLESGELKIFDHLDLSLIERNRSNKLVLVDALFGTGLSRDLSPEMIEVIESIRTLSCDTIVSIDLPSGLNAKTGRAMPATVMAIHTITLGAPKIGMLLNDGIGACGHIEVLDIGILEEDLEASRRGEMNIKLMSMEESIGLRPSKELGEHKLSKGALASITGSHGYPGAPILSALAAMRVGCGFVHQFLPQSIALSTNLEALEVVIHPLGSKEREFLIAADRVEIDLLIEMTPALLVGCGLGRDEETQELVKGLVRDYPKGVLDADGINAFELDIALLSESNISEWILTPHRGEFDRLIAASKFSNDKSIIDQVAGLAQKCRTNILLKGAPNILSDPGGNVFLVEGDSEFATAGTGDVLAGMIAGYLVQGLDPIEAGLCALATGKKIMLAFKERYPQLSMIASDLLSNEL